MATDLPTNPYSFFPHALWIDNVWQPADSGDTRPVTNPANGESLGEAPWAGQTEARRAVDAAAAAFPLWRRTPAPARAEYLLKIGRALTTHKEPLARLLTAENGKPLAQARGEIDYAVSFYRWFAEEGRRLAGRSVPHPVPGTVSWVDYEPVGVVGAITPWNFPIAQGAKKMSAALAAGCTIVLKPAPDTPLMGIAMGWIAEQIGLPAGVMNVVSGDAEAIAAAFYDDPRVRAVSFTGSVRGGTAVAGQAAARLKHVVMELGGNAPFIVLPDADLDDTVDQLIRLKLLTNGQTCVTANRVFVHASIADDFTGRLVEAARQIVIGDPLSQEVTLGPLINQAGLDKVTRLVDDAIQRGAACLSGGPAARDGLTGSFYPFTVLAGVDNSWPIAREEIFGPVLPVLTFDDDETLVAQANDTLYGLAGYVFGRDTARATRIARSLDVGIVGINDMRPLRAEVPFGGVKQSGLGREGGLEGLHDFLVAKTYSLRS